MKQEKWEERRQVMVSQDFGFRIKELSDRISKIEYQLNLLSVKSIEDEDWNNHRLMQEWNICRRTAANYRKNGLKYYKRGGRIFYTPESREQFIKQQKNKAAL